MNKKTRLILIVALVVLLLAAAALAILAFSMLGGGEATPETPTQSGSAAEPTHQTLDPNAMAPAETDGNVTCVYSVEELLESIDPSGNTVITLQQDISHTKAINLPYSCTIDFAGHTITTNPEQGLGLQIEEAGETNGVTALKNGTLVSFSDGLRVKEGGILLSGMQIDTAFGTCVALYDPDAAYKDLNRIENSTLISGSSACIGFSQQGSDFGVSGITLESSSLICCKEAGAKVFSTAGGETKPGVITLGSNVFLYSYGATACDDGTPFLGNTPVKETAATATAGEKSWENMTCWTTESSKEVLNILMIGNSFCYSYVDELYGMADALGYQLNITNLYRGGCSIKSHYTWLMNPIEGAGKCEYYITGALGRYKHPTITTLVDALDYAQWDVITCQQHFDGERTVDFAAGYESCSPYAADMYSYLKQHYPDAELYWQETWSYAVGYVHPNNKDDDATNDLANGDVLSVAIQTRQYETIRDVSKALCAESGVEMIPTGDAWQLARARLGDTLNKADCCHDGDAAGGQYLIACVWLEVLTGESCIGNTWRPVDYILFEEKIPALQDAAHRAVAAIYGDDYAK